MAADRLQVTTPETDPLPVPTRNGWVFVVLAAVSAGLCLLLPTLLLGFTMSVIAAVARGEPQAWMSSVALTYALLGVPAVLGIVALFIPYALYRAAARRVGTRPAIRWTFGLLVAWNCAVAVVFTRELEMWTSLGFGVAAVLTVLVAFLVERRAMGSAVVLRVPMALAALALVGSVLVYGIRAPGVPVNAQLVHVVLTESTIQVMPLEVFAGEVWIVVEGRESQPSEPEFFLVTALPGATGSDLAPPSFDDDEMVRLMNGDYTTVEVTDGWSSGQPVKLTLAEGSYAFLMEIGPSGVPIPPERVTTLIVRQ